MGSSPALAPRCLHSGDALYSAGDSETSQLSDSICLFLAHCAPCTALCLLLGPGWPFPTSLGSARRPLEALSGSGHTSEPLLPGARSFVLSPRLRLPEGWGWICCSEVTRVCGILCKWLLQSFLCDQVSRGYSGAGRDAPPPTLSQHTEPALGSGGLRCWPPRWELHPSKFAFLNPELSSHLPVNKGCFVHGCVLFVHEEPVCGALPPSRRVRAAPHTRLSHPTSSGVESENGIVPFPLTVRLRVGSLGVERGFVTTESAPWSLVDGSPVDAFTLRL